jgi:hypothetical protein
MNRLLKKNLKVKHESHYPQLLHPQKVKPYNKSRILFKNLQNTDQKKRRIHI